MTKTSTTGAGAAKKDEVKKAKQTNEQDKLLK